MAGTVKCAPNDDKLRRRTRMFPYYGKIIKHTHLTVKFLAWSLR